MTAALRIEGLHAGYGPAKVLFGIDLDVAAGAVTALLGRNGMGKTTTVRSLMGLLQPTGGRVELFGEDVTGCEPHRIAQGGIGLVPEGREVFPTLSVVENLRATARPGPAGDGWTVDRVFAFFPRLAERQRHLGGQLSGGEQQMLVIGRALMTNPRLLVLDEATEGLAPLIREEIWDRLRRLKAEGLAILVIDKNLSALATLADQFVVLDKGRVVRRGTAADLAADPASVEAHLHL